MRLKWKLKVQIGVTLTLLSTVIWYFYLPSGEESKTRSDATFDNKKSVHILENVNISSDIVLKKITKITHPLKTKNSIHLSEVEPRKTNSIHLSVVACGDHGEAAMMVLKSAILFTKTPLTFHVFAEIQIQHYLKRQLEFWPNEFRARMDYFLYNLTFPEGEQKNWKSLFKPCASQRLFIPTVLKNVDALLYVDTDVLFLRPIDDIWNFFTKFNRTQLIALAPEHEDSSMSWYARFARHPYYGRFGVNSGVMLMNLTRLRTTSWQTSMLKFYKEYKLKIVWGDQDLINIYFHFHPDELYVYPCMWNYRPDHCMYMSVCKGVDRAGVSVLHGCRGVFHNDRMPAFRAVYFTFLKHRLGADIKYDLMPALERALRESGNTECSKLANAFTHNIQEYIKSLNIYYKAKV